MKAKTFSYNNTDIFYEVHGNGKPVVLLHGFAETGAVWFHQTQYLKNNFKVIVPDLPGYGKSSLFDIKIAETQIDDYANYIYALLKHEEAENVVLIGHSMGGYITLSLAKNHPEILSAIGFVHSTAFADNEEKKQKRLRGIEMIENYGGYAFLKNTIPNLFAQKFKNENFKSVEKLIEDGKSLTNTSLQQSYYAMMNRHDATSVLSNAHLPVLFIAGKEDTAVLLGDVLKQVSLPEISYFHLLNNTGHMGMWEAADTVNEFVEEFINDVL